MDRDAVLRWFLIGGLMLAFWKWGLPLITGKSGGETQASHLAAETYQNAPGFVPDVVDPGVPGAAPLTGAAEGEVCTIAGNRFVAELSSRGAGLKHFYLKDPKYAGTEANDMSTTPDVERWHSLRTLFRASGAASGAEDQLKYDRFNWQLARGADGRRCTFTYEEEGARVVKAVVAGERPYELEVETTVTNLADGPRRHQLTVGTYAFRYNREMKGSLGRVSPFLSELSCARTGSVDRKTKDDFAKGWFTVPAVDHFAAVSNYYFGQALVPVGADGSSRPDCSILAEDWFQQGQSREDESAAIVFHAMLVYPAQILSKNASATYRQVAFLGPKEREVLAKAAGGNAHLTDLVNLGFFSPVARVLVAVLDFFHDHVTGGSWGAAIIAMTVCLRLLLFPLSVPQIRTTVGMRRLKPEIDALNAKFPDDPQARQLATMELYRKNNVSVLGGCLPQLAQMPIWFAMYTTLQTAVQMFHTRFWWFSDLSGPDKYYVLPVVLGALMIVQQRIVPQQGMDPVQQKMMTYMLPGIFFVMMLFLPAALGVYMMTNSALGIAQQLVVEKVILRRALRPAAGDIVIKQRATS